ncbi:MAG TPA: UrcA family protein [Steroidobacteraceae bacterium]|nr:UrcA family protein [Steroidobacteraceae bacterium]
MTRQNSVFVLRRTSERLTAGAAAIGATFLMLLTVDVRAAEADTNPPRVSVSYQQTDLATEKGTAKVYRKLKIAAEKVCGGLDARLSLVERGRALKCVDAALADVVQRIDSQTLTSVHAASARDLG